MSHLDAAGPDGGTGGDDAGMVVFFWFTLLLLMMKMYLDICCCGCCNYECKICFLSLYMFSVTSVIVFVDYIDADAVDDAATVASLVTDDTFDAGLGSRAVTIVPVDDTPFLNSLVGAAFAPCAAAEDCVYGAGVSADVGVTVA